MKNRILKNWRNTLWVFCAVAVVSVYAARRGSQTVAAAQQLAPCATLPAGAVAWYRSEGNLNDAAGGHDGIPFGDVYFLPGRDGKGFAFDGVGEVTVPDEASLSPRYLTLEAWVYPTDLNGNFEVIAAKENEPSGLQYALALKGPAGNITRIPRGQLAFALGGISGLPDDDAGWVAGGGAVPIYAWTHVALTFDGTTARTFINGKVARTLTGLRGLLPLTNGALKIGARASGFINNAPNERYNGRIDELTLYNRALTTAEIAAIVSSANAGRCYDTPPIVRVERGSPITRQQGSLPARVTLATVSDEQTEAGQLAVKLENIPAGLSVSQLTNTDGEISALIAPSCNAAVGAYNLVLQVSDGKLTATANPVINLTANTAPSLGNYQNTEVQVEQAAVITPNAAPKDHGSVTSVTVSGLAGATINAATGAVTIPATAPAGTATLTVRATDNCGAVTTRTWAVTVKEVCSSSPAGLVGWYRAENNANDALDANHGRLHNGIAFAPGKVGQAFQFDGVNDAVILNESIGNFGKGAFSLGFWIRTTSTRMEAVLSKRSICNYSSFWDVRIIDGQLAVELDQTDSTAYNLLKADRKVNDGNFHHVLITRQGAILSLYLDGKLERSQVKALTANVFNSAKLAIGTGVCVNVDQTQPFTGQLDELEIYGRALTPVEVLSSFRAGSAGHCVDTATAVAAPLALAISAGEIMTPRQLVFAPSLVISQFRFSGSQGANDWYVELYNYGKEPVYTTGLTMGLINQPGSRTLSFALTPDQVIAPYSSYLVTGSAYSLGVTAVRPQGVLPDQRQAALPFEQAAAVALFAGLPLAANRLDVVGTQRFSGSASAYDAEGEPLSFLNGLKVEHAFMRRFSTSVKPQDSDNNVADFVLIAPPGTQLNGHQALPVSPSPRNRLSPPRRP
jgi:hypothetical protein